MYALHFQASDLFGDGIGEEILQSKGCRCEEEMHVRAVRQEGGNKQQSLANNHASVLFQILDTALTVQHHQQHIKKGIFSLD
jgi:hypothetical protein